MFFRRKKPVAVVQENGVITTSAAVGGMPTSTPANLDPNLSHTIQTIRTIPPQNQGRTSLRGFLLFVVILACSVVLALPYECGETSLPKVLCVPNYQKVMASFLLGLMTMGVIMGPRSRY